MFFWKFVIDFVEKYCIVFIQFDEKVCLMLENYSWLGNIWEFKNVVEQVLVMVEEKFLDVGQLLQYVFQFSCCNLLMIVDCKGGDGDGVSMQEWEIFYKFMFDMKNDLNDLKMFVFEFICNNDFCVFDVSDICSLQVFFFDYFGMNVVDRWDVIDFFYDYYDDDFFVQDLFDSVKFIIFNYDDLEQQ